MPAPDARVHVEQLEYAVARIALVLNLDQPRIAELAEQPERWPDYFLAFENSFNCFPGFNYEVQGVYQERSDKGIEFYTYAVRE